MILSLLVALTKSRGVIGRDNTLPWSLPNDLKRFKRLTMGHPMIMGRKTYESIGKPLPGRRNLVISRNAAFKVPTGAEVFTSLEAACRSCKPDDEVFVIGGAQIISEALPQADRLYLTWIDHDFPGDVFFPNFKTFLNDFKVVTEQDEVEPFPYSFVDYVRTTPKKNYG